MEEHGQLFTATAAALLVVLAYCSQEFSANTDALPFGHYNEARCPVSSCSKKRGYGQVANRLAVYEADKILGGHRGGQV